MQEATSGYSTAPVDDLAKAGAHLVPMGDQMVEIRRLTTRNGIQAAQQVLGYIRAIREPLQAVWSIPRDEQGNRDGTATRDAGLEVLDALINVLDEDDLLSFAARLLGLPKETVAEAPMEDTLNAIAEAFEVNRMDSLVASANRIAQVASKSFKRS